ncbi:DUF2867 domain-containing protein [Flavobacterium xinjiangense]|uniref:DUF2867 domain-containing protein n=1 Tax=Flavobacterium xinjiangense TaxID=178356 RepID=A0A1M7P9W0_9FLAO|nr:DUF2867 domain-containing protein [Flavobacterium xinjiangense]SHN13506.1 Protein of unknown function [Flavobacterium xinjiangense]
MKITPKIKIDKHSHLTQFFKVHTLLSDFELEDVWQVPVILTSNHSLHIFVEHFNISLNKIMDKGVAGFLFQLRLWLGKFLNLDDKNQLVRELTPGSIRHRYAHEEGLSFEDLPALSNGSPDFKPVYTLKNEYLSEIDNKTVHAALHFSRVPIGEAIWGVHMAVYVKPKGSFGKIYMLLIKPFRLWIVYPALMKIIKNEWESFVRLDTLAQNDGQDKTTNR